MTDLPQHRAGHLSINPPGEPAIDPYSRLPSSSAATRSMSISLVDEAAIDAVVVVLRQSLLVANYVGGRLPNRRRTPACYSHDINAQRL